MIAPNRMDTNDTPEVRFPVAWPAAVANNARGIIEHLHARVYRHWPRIAPLVELARVAGTGGVLCVSLDATSGVAVRDADGEIKLMANAAAQWRFDPPPLSLVGDASAADDWWQPPTAEEVSILLAVMAGGLCTEMVRICAADPHAKWLAAEIDRGTDYEHTPCVVVTLNEAMV